MRETTASLNSAQNISDTHGRFTKPEPPNQTLESLDKVNGGELGDQMKRGLPRTVRGSRSRLIFNYIVYVRNSYT